MGGNKRNNTYYIDNPLLVFSTSIYLLRVCGLLLLRSGGYVGATDWLTHGRCRGRGCRGRRRRRRVREVRRRQSAVGGVGGSPCLGDRRGRRERHPAVGAVGGCPGLREGRGWRATATASFFPAFLEVSVLALAAAAVVLLVLREDAALEHGLGHEEYLV